MKAVFFLHIPKTAGTSMNSCLESELSPSRTHIESDRINCYQNVPFSQLRFVSGHIKLSEARRISELSRCIRITVLRDPKTQLLSHIEWVLDLCSDTYSERYKRQSQDVRSLAHHLSEIDFTSVSSVEEGFANLSSFGKLLFSNCQTRYLMSTPDPVSIGHDDLDSAIKGLSFFDIIGRVDRINAFWYQLRKITNLAGLAELPVSNVRRKSRLGDLSSDVFSVLTPFFCIDELLYRVAFNESSSDFCIPARENL